MLLRTQQERLYVSVVTYTTRVFLCNVSVNIVTYITRVFVYNMSISTTYIYNKRVCMQCKYCYIHNTNISIFT